MTAPEMKQVKDFCETRISFPKRPDLNFFSEKYITYYDDSATAFVEVAPETVDIKSASYTLNATVGTPTALVDASTHTTAEADITYGYMLVESGTGYLTLIGDATTDVPFLVIKPNTKELIPVRLGSGGHDITSKSTVASDVIKVTLFGEEITLDVNDQFAGAS